MPEDGGFANQCLLIILFGFTVELMQPVFIVVKYPTKLCGRSSTKNM